VKFILNVVKPPAVTDCVAEGVIFDNVKKPGVPVNDTV
jgi:hypothetical protein